MTFNEIILISITDSFLDPQTSFFLLFFPSYVETNLVKKTEKNKKRHSSGDEKFYTHKEG